MADLPNVIAYIDGSAQPNPGAGGAGIVLLFGEHRLDMRRYLGALINSRQAEMLAAIHALRALKSPCKVVINSDSQCLVSGMNSPASRVGNDALWSSLDQLATRHTITWHKVKGHSNNRLNIQADHLAKAAAQTRSDLEFRRQYLSKE